MYKFNGAKQYVYNIEIFLFQAQNGFDELRRYVKQGSDFSKELASILQER